ncbi:uncharacterized protein [Euwallacea fornicatus]|uniref:uncharacterized protein isoform X1 n=1 Tax=Euwallacea fornicatus TaxID=995702 RepID=UPI00338D7B9F
MNLLWLLLPGSLALVALANPKYQRCLTDEPEVSPKKYFYVNGTSLNIRVETSERITHQLVTSVFLYFIREVVGYANIEKIEQTDNFEIAEVIQRLTDFTGGDKKTDRNGRILPPEASSTINLEVWISPEYDTYVTDFVKECGNLSPPGRFGWFIPINLTGPIKEYYSQEGRTDIRTIHWRHFRDPNFVKFFEIEDKVVDTLLKMAFENATKTLFVCPDSEGCVNSTFVPPQCEGTQVCALLLTADYLALKFVKKHIMENELYVKVLFLGKKLESMVHYVTNSVYNHTKNNKSLVILSWTPSDVILYERNFVTVSFENCESLNFTQESGYKYEMHRLVKVAWDKVEKYASPLHYHLRRFKFNAKQYSDMLKLYEDHKTHNKIEEIACMWMRNNKHTWLTWKQNQKNYIYIGGIFPMSGSSYAGKGIARGAMMAISALNKNRTVLSEYDFHMIATDGMCQPDNVMKNFIDFIVNKEYHNSLVGVLGPACSDTVEPLAGVSKHYHTLIISYAAEGSSFSNREKYPYFFRTIGENMHYRHVYQALFQKFGWKRVAALTEDGQKYTEYISLMQDDLEKSGGITFIANKKFPRERESDTMTRYLEDLQAKKARIVIADVVDEVARQVMCEAYKKDMTAYQGYVWFLPIWLETTWYDTDKYNVHKNESVNCTTAEMIKAVTGYFSMTHAYYAPDDSIMQENITVREWRNRYENTSSNLISDYAGFAYDAVWVYALALDKLSRSDPEALADMHSANTTGKLVKLIEQTDFFGVSGRIKFRGAPSRFSIINVLQWYDNSTHMIAEFFPNLTNNDPVIRGGNLKFREKVRWFTSNEHVPEDGTVPVDECAIQLMATAFNVQCQTALIILNVMVAMFLGVTVMGVCLYLKYKYDKKVKKQKAYMKKLGLRYERKYTMDLEEFEIPKENIEITRRLGEGAFGMVYGGDAYIPPYGWYPVAVKTLKSSSTAEDQIDFLSEADNMKRFDHKNVVRLIAVMTKATPLATLMEYCLYGDLKNFLLSRRYLLAERAAEDNKNVEALEDITPKRLTNMALDIARGLSYLAELKYVHRDLACRNCLVNAQKMVKIGDFGMSRPMSDYASYHFTRKGMLPVRWMAPESLTSGVFSTATDIWSYGVVLYEIITFGCSPWVGRANMDVVDMVIDGQSLDVPKGAKPQLEGLMKSCWSQDPKERPPASEIVEYIANLPKLLNPCMVPLQSITMDDGDGLGPAVECDFHLGHIDTIPNTTNINSGDRPRNPYAFTLWPQTRTTGSKAPLPPLITDHDESTVSMQLENYCPKEPLLGPSKSSSSLIGFGKFNMHSNRRDSGCQNDDEGFGNSPANGFINKEKRWITRLFKFRQV